jgi:glycolate oxidase iron-sulfur subunit
MSENLIKDLRKCVRCGGCKALCPTYGRDHVEPMSARGRMILLLGLLEGELEPSDLLVERLTSCLLCGMCDTACPVGVDVTEAIYKGRERLRDSDRRGRRLRRLLGFALRRPHLSFRAAGLLKPLLPYLQRRGALPFDVSLPSEPLRKGLRLYKPRKALGRVAVFTGCAVNFIYPHLGESLISVLLKAGYEVVLPGGEICCGAPLRAAGLGEEARRFAERNLEAFSKLQAEAVLSLCPTCTLTVKNQYPKLVGQGLETAKDATEFLADRIELPARHKGKTAAYHDPCHLGYGLGVREQPRRILRRLGYELLEPQRGSCCGFGVSFTHSGISEDMLQALPEEYRRANALVTACPGCMAQLARNHANVIHIIEAVDDDETA